jgi:hypothetical protein
MIQHQVDQLVSLLTAWATTRPDLTGVGLVGSWAYGNARPDSDLDLVFLTPDPERFRDPAWIQEVDWASIGFHPAHWVDQDYGALWSRHLTLEPMAEVECGFAAPSWAATEPIDPGTYEVVSHALRPLYDPAGDFARLQAAVVAPGVPGTSD